ncbi:MAG: TIGR04283 family arsenosugar biosynthesis glycosyltransferase [Nitrospira sp.]|nr:TIGR04283 family arsenosugar biosynthesis glycosyltransferase [Nitrospira sp.]
MKLSIIIPALNEERSIGQTLERAISIQADEVIVVDGGSQDTTREIAKPLASHVMESLRGRALQMNAGAKAAHGDVFLFLHADTLLHLETKWVIQEVLFDPKVVGGRFDIRLDRAGWLYGLVAHLVNLRSRLTKVATGDQAIFVRREVFEQIGGFSEISLMEDVEFNKSLKRLGKIACLRKKVVTSARRWEHHGPLKTILLMWRLRFLYFIGVSPDRLKSYYVDIR